MKSGRRPDPDPAEARTEPVAETTNCYLCDRPIPQGALARTNGAHTWHLSPCIAPDGFPE